MAAAASLSPAGTIRPLTFATLFGLLAATGMRISEALALRLSDITEDGLVIEKTKFKKSRLLPLHSSTRQALDAYLEARLRVVADSDAMLVGNTGEAVAYTTANAVFLRLARSIGLRGAFGSGGARIHDLRHTFAVRSLEACPADTEAVSRHIVGLSTYLGHAHVTDTYWYLQASPALTTHIAAAGEALQQGRDAMTALAPSLTSFLREHLPRDRRASPHTCEAYAYSFQLLVTFAARRLRTKPCQLDIEHLEVPMILAFLEHLEQERGNAARSRNARLAKMPR